MGAAGLGLDRLGGIWTLRFGAIVECDSPWEALMEFGRSSNVGWGERSDAQQRAVGVASTSFSMTIEGNVGVRFAHLNEFFRWKKCSTDLLRPDSIRSRLGENAAGRKSQSVCELDDAVAYTRAHAESFAHLADFRVAPIQLDRSCACVDADAGVRG